MVSSNNWKSYFREDRIKQKDMLNFHYRNCAILVNGSARRSNETLPKNTSAPCGVKLDSNKHASAQLETSSVASDVGIDLKISSSPDMSKVENKSSGVGQCFQEEQCEMFRKLPLNRQTSQTDLKKLENSNCVIGKWSPMEKRDFSKDEVAMDPQILERFKDSWNQKGDELKPGNTGTRVYQIDYAEKPENNLMSEYEGSVWKSEQMCRNMDNKYIEENRDEKMKFEYEKDDVSTPDIPKECLDEYLPDCNQCTEKSIDTPALLPSDRKETLDKNGCNVHVSDKQGYATLGQGMSVCEMREKAGEKTEGPSMVKACKEEKNGKLSQLLEQPFAKNIGTTLCMEEPQKVLLKNNQHEVVAKEDQICRDEKHDVPRLLKKSEPNNHVNEKRVYTVISSSIHVTITPSHNSKEYHKTRKEKNKNIKHKRRNLQFRKASYKRCRNYCLQKRVQNRHWECLEFLSWGFKRIETWNSGLPSEDIIKEIMKRMTIRRTKFSRHKTSDQGSHNSRSHGGRGQFVRGSHTKRRGCGFRDENGCKKRGDGWYRNGPSDSATGQGGGSHGGARPKGSTGQSGQRAGTHGSHGQRRSHQGKKGNDDSDEEEEGHKKRREMGAYGSEPPRVEPRPEEEMETETSMPPHGVLDIDVVDALGILGETDPGGGGGAMNREIVRRRKEVSQQFSKCLIHQLGEKDRRASVDCPLCLHLALLLKHAAKMECDEKHCQLCFRLLRVIKTHVQSCIITLARQRSVASDTEIPIEETTCQIKLCIAVQKKIVESGKELSVASLEDLLRKKKLWVRIREHLRAMFREGAEVPPTDLPNFSSVSFRSGMSSYMGTFGSLPSVNDSVFYSSRLASRVPAQPTIPEESVGYEASGSIPRSTDISFQSGLHTQTFLPQRTVTGQHSLIQPDDVPGAFAVPRTPSLSQQSTTTIYDRNRQGQDSLGPATLGYLPPGEPPLIQRGPGLQSLPALGNWQGESRARLASEQFVADSRLQYNAVYYGNKTHMIEFARHWEEMKIKLNQGNLEILPNPEEGVILSPMRRMLRLLGKRYRKHHEWQRVSSLGNGVFGKCHLAVDLSNSFQFCVKRIHLVKFEPCELEIWSSLQHPNIVQLYGAIRRQDKIYIFAEFIDGGSLAELIEEQRQLNSWMALFYLNQLLGVLCYLQKSGVIHDDLKADNILLRANTLQIVVIDFGLCQQIASSTNPSVACNVSPVGAQTQWSPEKAASEGYDAKAMVWAAGCILVHMLSGHYPWTRGYGHLKMLHFVIKSKSPPLWDIPDGLPAELTELIHQCWAVEPVERPLPGMLLNHPAFHLLNRNFTSGTFMQHIVEMPVDENVPSVVGDMNQMAALNAGKTITQSLTSEMDIYGAENPSGPVRMSNEITQDSTMYSGVRPSGDMPLIPPIRQSKGLPFPRTSTAANSGDLPNLSIFRELDDSESIDLNIIEKRQESGSGDNPLTSSSVQSKIPESNRPSRFSVEFGGGDRSDFDIKFNYKSLIVEPPPVNFDIQFAPISPEMVPHSMKPPPTQSKHNIPTLDITSLPNMANLQIQSPTGTEGPRVFPSLSKIPVYDDTHFSQQRPNVGLEYSTDVTEDSSRQGKRKIDLYINISPERDDSQLYTGLPDSHSAPVLSSVEPSRRPIHRSITFPNGNPANVGLRRDISHQTSGFSETTPSPAGTTPSPLRSNKSSGFGDGEVLPGGDVTDFNLINREWLQQQISRETDPEKQEAYIKAFSDISDPDEVEEKHESEIQEKAEPLSIQKTKTNPGITVKFDTKDGRNLTKLIVYKHNCGTWQDIIKAVAQSIHHKDPSLKAFTIRQADSQDIDLTELVVHSQQHSSITIKVIVIPAPDGGTWNWRMVAGDLQYGPDFAGPFGMLQ